jgi:two-component system sensor histidine kinase/response regulator
MSKSRSEKRRSSASGERTGRSSRSASITSDISFARAKSELFYSMYFSTSAPAIAIDRESTITRANDAIEHLLEYAPTTLTGMKLNDIMAKGSRHINHTTAVTQAFDTTEDQIHKSPVVVRKRSGAEITLHITLQRIMNEYAITFSQAGLATEYSRRMDLEEKNTFMTSVSHELRTPLNSATLSASYTEKLLVDLENKLHDEGVSDDTLSIFYDVRDSNATTLSSNGTLDSIITSALDYAKLRRGSITLMQTDFNLSETIAAIVQTHAPTVKLKHLEFSHTIADDVPTLIIGDQTRYTQMVNNLLTNAIKFTKTGSVKLTVEAEQPPNTPDQVYIITKISDTGPGINRADRQRIFDEFVQLAKTPADKLGGLGLGLAICRKICQLMDGDIKIKSVKPTGCTFVARCRFEVSARLAKPELSDIALAGIKVLFVDDDNLNLQTYLQWSFEYGMIPIIAPSAKLGLVLLANNPDVKFVVCDFVMPEMNGVEFTKKAIQRGYQSIYILAASDDPGETNKLFSEILSKPVKKEKMFRVMKKHLDGSTRFRFGSSDSFSGPVSSEDQSKDIRVLVVDDQPDYTALMHKMLTAAGYTVDTADDGAVAYEMIKATKYDITLVDIIMPTPGTVCCEKVRSLPKNRQPIMIAVTAVSHSSGLNYYLEQGFDDYIGKPVNMQTVYDIVKKHVN